MSPSAALNRVERDAWQSVLRHSAAISNESVGSPASLPQKGEDQMTCASVCLPKKRTAHKASGFFFRASLESFQRCFMLGIPAANMSVSVGQ